jgi:hypothetical protein
MGLINMTADSIFDKTSLNELANHSGIDTFYLHLKELFDVLGLLDNLEDNSTRNKFSFIEVYPDQEYRQNNVVTFNILESTPYISQSIIGKSAKHNRPRYSSEDYNRTTGNVEHTYYSQQFHCLELRCFSVSGKTCKELTRLIETIFITHCSTIKKNVKDFIHISTKGVEYIGEYDNKRLFSSAIYFKIVTAKEYVVELEHLKNITLTLNN